MENRRVTITGEKLQDGAALLRAEAHRAPVEVTYAGRPELVVMSVEDYALLRTNRRLPLLHGDMPRSKL
ncbi:MAG TPA: type II toxin-antitoxin system prevent-host-death family antitoxin, partial [Acetobacteraceae bacterium]